MKKFLIVAFAALGLVACNDNNLDDVHNDISSGEVATSYISINLSAAEKGTRVEGGEYQEGLEAERAVKSAYFFFFNADGSAFPVTAVAGQPATAPGTGVNWISATLNNVGSDMPNVSDIKDAVLVLSTYEGEYPAQVVAVINWVPTADTPYSLDDLYAKTNITGVDGGFVMSNAVYSDGTKAVVGTPLAESDIYTSPADALANPITIHVERIAAKVTVTANGVADGRYSVRTAKISGEDTGVYVQVIGWELYNDFTQSKLLKEIDPAWSDMTLGFTWNDAPYYRSYWAESLEIGDIVDNDFPTTFSLTLGDASDVTAGTYDDNTYTYVGENTNYVVDNTDNCTKLIIKAKLQKKVSEGVYEDIQLARWYTTYYKDLDALFAAVANTIKYQYCWYDNVNSKYNYIAPADLAVVEDGNMVKFQLSATGSTKNWFTSNGSGYIAKTIDEMNASLGALEKALYYDDAETLYSVDIAHLGNGDADAHKAGDYGVVRNHIYNIVLNSFGSFGSPVYIPGGNLVYPENPEDPENERDYVSAEVRVLSWRMVSQEVDVQP